MTVTTAEAVLVACRVEEDCGGPGECSERAVVDTKGATVVAGAWTELALVEENGEALVDTLPLWWNRWEEEETSMEGLEKWIKARTVRNAETNPPRCRDPAELH